MKPLSNCQGEETSARTLLAASLMKALYMGSCLWAGRLNQSMSSTMDTKPNLKLACLHQNLSTLSETTLVGCDFLTPGENQRSMVTETRPITLFRGAKNMRSNIAFDQQITRTVNPTTVNSSTSFVLRMLMGREGFDNLNSTLHKPIRKLNKRPQKRGLEYPLSTILPARS